MESMNLNGQPYSASMNQTESIGNYTAKTFGWMFAGLIITFLIMPQEQFSMYLPFRIFI